MINYKELFGSYLGYISTNAVKFTSNITQFVRPMLNSALTKLKTTKLADYLVYLGVAAAGLSSAYILKDQLLHKAVKKGYLWAIKPLIAFGANVDATDALGNTPLHQAAEKGELWKAKLLIAFGANVDAKNNDNKTPLHLAARNEDLDAITVLVEAGADVVGTQDKNGYTPLDWVAINGQTEAFKLLIVKVADVDVIGFLGNTPLHHAAIFGESNAIKVLVEKGAKVNTKNNDNQTPLHLAVLKGHIDAAELLIMNEKTDVNAKNSDNKTPLHLAEEAQDVRIINLLKAREAIEAKIKRNGHVDAKCNGHQETLLHEYALWGRLDEIKILINCFKANVNARNELEKTPLHWSAFKGHLEVIKALIGAGANVDAADKLYQTPLHYAAEKGNTEAIKVLIEAGADVDAKDKDGNRPIDLTSNAEVKALLEEALRERADNEAAHAADAEVDGAIEVSLEFKGSELNYSEYENLQTKHQPSLKGLTDEVSSDSNDGYAQAAGLVQKASDDLQEV